MSTTELRKRAKKKIDAIPATKLQSAVDFIDFLSVPASYRSRPPLVERLKQSEQEFRAGLGTPVEKLRRKYRRA